MATYRSSSALVFAQDGSLAVCDVSPGLRLLPLLGAECPQESGEYMTLIGFSLN